MELSLTNEEKEAIKYYKENAFNNINQLLVADSRSDIDLLSDDANEELEINYDRTSIATYIDTIKKVYTAMLKKYFSKSKKENWTFTKSINLSEIEKFKNEPYIDRFLLTNSKEVNKNNDVINNQVILYICGDSEIPYMKLDDESETVLISLFTKVKDIQESSEIKVEDKSIRTYKLMLEKQELEEMTDDDKLALYNYIISNSDLVNTTLSNTVRLEKENISNYESIRELEKKISDLEAEINKKEMEQDYTETEKNSDNFDLNELKEKLEIFKNHSANIFDNIKNNNQTILFLECVNILVLK